MYWNENPAIVEESTEAIECRRGRLSTDQSFLKKHDFFIAISYLASKSVTSSFFASTAFFSDVTFSSVCFVTAFSYSLKLQNKGSFQQRCHKN